jgi:hypothetical protein
MIDFTGWKYYTNPMGENIGITITNGNTQESRLLTDPDVTAWIENGGIPLPAENT